MQTLIEESDIYWITVMAKPNRIAWFENANIRRFPNWHWKRVNGFYAKQLNIKPFGDALCQSQGHLGCWLSHYMAWQIFIHSEKPEAFFLEDDTLILDCIREVSDEIRGQTGFTHVGVYNGSGTWAYHIDRQTAITLTEKFQIRTSHIDCQIWDSGFHYKKTRIPCAEHMGTIIHSITSGE